MTLELLLRTLRARWYIPAAAMIVCLSTAVAASLFLPKRYAATADLVINVSSQDPISGAPFPPHMLSSYLATQADIVRSPSVAAKVVSRTRLADDPALQEQLLGAPVEQPTLTRLAAALLRRVEVRTALEASIISINFTAPVPDLAARFADEFAAAYLATGVELRTAPARQVSNWYAEQLAELRQDLERAQQVYTDYQRRHDVLAVDQHLDLELVRLSNLSAMLLEAEGKRLASSSRERQLQEPGGTLAEVLNDPVIQNLRGQLGQAEASLSELATRVGANHPRLGEARAEIEALRRRLDTEMASARRSLVSSARLTVDQEQELRDRLEEQRARVLALREQRDRLAVLAREVEHAERAYGAALERAAQSRLESRLLPHTNVALLSGAVAPLQPTFPDLRLNVAGGLLLGLVLGMGGAFRAELRDRRVRVPADLERVLDIPVLARLSAPRRMVRLHEGVDHA